ncbi:MAG: HDOD domain-containing protein [Betaproteobacteria bacterium]|nr:HDOD domain-containing protein [Betaproteobacteria bacterium]
MVPPATLAPQEARRIVDEVDIPPCPAVLTAVLKEMRREEPDFPAMGTRIASDLGLSAALLKTVNSPFYGLGRR